jgi:hypothetical protein
MYFTVFKCVLCNEQTKYIIEDLPVGTRGFCSEKCYCDYLNIQYLGEGWHGLEDFEWEWVKKNEKK